MMFHRQDSAFSKTPGAPTTGPRLTSIMLDPELQAQAALAPQGDAAHAMTNLMERSDMVPNGVTTDFALHILRDAREALVLESRDSAGNILHTGTLGLSPLRQSLRDYTLMIEGFQDASRDANPMRMQAIDAGRRMVHDQGAETLRHALEGQVTLSAESARALFTLIHSVVRRAA